MIIALAVMMTVGMTIDGEPEIAHLFDEIHHHDREIVRAQTEGRASSTVLVALPQPFRAEHALEYLALFDPTKEQRRQCKEAFLTFQIEYLNAQGRFIPDMWALAAKGVDGDDSEQAQLSEQRHELLERFDRHGYSLEATLIGTWRQILLDDEGDDRYTAALLQFVQDDRLRRRYSIWTRFALPEARTDLFDLTEKTGSPEDSSEAMIVELRRYVAQRGLLMRDRFRQKLHVTPKATSLIAEHTRGDLSWDDFINQRSRLRQRIVNLDAQLERLNQQTLLALRQELDAAVFSDMRRTHLHESYPDLLPDQVDDRFRQSVDDWLTSQADDERLTRLILAVLADYERWYEARIEWLMRVFSRSHRQFYLHLTFDAFDEDERHAALTDFAKERDERIQRITTLMDELSAQAAR